MSESDHTAMFYNASPKIFERAKALRENMTEAEFNLWEFLRSKRLLNLRFRAQHPIDRFIADFYCHPLKLVIEIDGGIHKTKEQREYDINREAELDRFEIKVIRFANEEIDDNINLVVNRIKNLCSVLKSERKSPLRGFRG